MLWDVFEQHTQKTGKDGPETVIKFRGQIGGKDFIEAIENARLFTAYPMVQRTTVLR